MSKARLSDLAIFGGPVAFDRVRPTSNLVRPEFDVFLEYSRVFVDARRYSNDGPVNRLLESRLAEFHEVDRCVTFSSGFWGLVLAIKALALPSRAEVVMPSLTYRRLADAAAWAGLIPNFCDVDAETLAVASDTVVPCINGRTALILGVHPIVNCCDAPGLESLSRSKGIPVLLDAVESAYETVGGRRVGSFGSCELFSMHASKLINGFEGGYITTNDRDLADELSLARGFGFESQDCVVSLGTNAKLNEVHAAMALASLDDVTEQVERNRCRYDRYLEVLSGIPGLRLLEFDRSQRPAFKNIVVDLTEEWPLSRSETLSVLHAEGALARAYYSPPLHTKTTSYETITRPLPVTEAFAERLLVLPSGHHVSDEDIRMIGSMLSVVASGGDSVRRRLQEQRSHAVES